VGLLPRRKLGSSAVEVTELGLGGAALGNLYEPVSDGDARATIEAALAGGVGYVDTAPYYGYGLSEERVGAALAGRPTGSPVLSSKVGRLLVPRSGAPRDDQGFVEARPYDPVFDYTYDGVMRSWEESRRRLARPRIGG
jgi:D-threo-aldose 1-dehydrogenase